MVTFHYLLLKAQSILNNNHTDSQVTPREAHSVVTSAAYLLFYRRRRTPYPLGPPYLKQLVESTWADPPLATTEGRGDTADDSAASASASSSRATSPSRSGQGKARGLGGSPSIGSPSAYRAAPAAAAAVASARGVPAAATSSAARGPLRTVPAEPLPAYEDDEDEGISLEDPPTVGHFSTEWRWTVDAPASAVEPHLGADDDSGDADAEGDDVDVEVGSTEAADGDFDDIDAGSNEAADGDSDGDADGKKRLLEAFGDELSDDDGLRFGHVAATDDGDGDATRFEDEFMAEDDADAVDHVIDDSEMLIGDEEEEDVPVAEVRVDEGSESGHMKMD